MTYPARAIQIRDELSNAETVEQVNAIARAAWPDVQAMEATKCKEHRVAAIHIKQLAAWMRRDLERHSE